MRTDLDRDALLELITSVLSEEQQPVADSFWQSVRQPSSFRENLLDTRLIKGFDVERRVQFGYKHDATDRAGAHYVAFLRPANERTVVGLRVRSRSGQPLRLLSVEQRLRLITSVLDHRLRDAVRSPQGPGPVDNGLLLELLELICADRPIEFGRAEIDKQQSAASERALVLIQGHMSEKAALAGLGSTAEFVGILAARNPLVCEVPRDDAGFVEYEMRESIAGLRGTSSTVGDQVALALGAIPAALTIPLYMAGQSAGYTLEVDVGLGNYVRSVVTTDETGTAIHATGAGTQLATVVSDTTPSLGASAVIGVAEHPSKTMLSALLLCVATFLAVLGAWLARDSIAVWHGDSVSVGDLGTLLGIVAVAAGGIRAVAYQGLQGRTLTRGALVSALGSAVTLVALAAVLIGSEKDQRNAALTVLLILAAGALVGIGAAFVRAVRQLAGLRRTTSSDHPETPSTARRR